MEANKWVMLKGQESGQILRKIEQLLKVVVRALYSLIVACMHAQSSDSFETIGTIARQAPPSMGFSRQGYWSGVPLPSPGDLPDLGVLHCRQILYQLSYQGIPKETHEQAPNPAPAVAGVAWTKAATTRPANRCQAVPTPSQQCTRASVPAHPMSRGETASTGRRDSKHSNGRKALDWKRWQSRRTRTHPLSQKPQNHNELLNNHQQKKTGTYQKKRHFTFKDTEVATRW